MATETETAEERGLQVLRVAAEIYERDPSWVTFFRDVLGIEGVVAQTYPTPELRAAFERTSTYQRLLEMLARLREKETGGGPRGSRIA